MVNDNTLYEIYQQGFSDEFAGKEKTYDTFIENRAYQIGKNHYVLGDSNRSFDSLSKEQILMIIKVLR